MARTKKADEITVEKTPVVEEKRDYSKKVQIPMNFEIPVKSNVQGGLVYVSRKTGYTERWEQMGDVVYLEFQELVSMKNASKRFFTDNWVIILDTEEYTAEQIYYALQVDKYYKNISAFEDIDDVFKLSITDIGKIVPELSNGYKQIIITRAITLIKENSPLLDSKKKINALEKALGVELE